MKHQSMILPFTLSLLCQTMGGVEAFMTLPPTKHHHNHHAFTKRHSTLDRKSGNKSNVRLLQSTSTNQESSTKQQSSQPSSTTQSRPLGSQELLMLPRQYGPHLDKTSNNNPNPSPFPQMSHVSTVILSSTPSLSTLSQSINDVMEIHPLLRCYVNGDGEPTKRIDAFQMVREGDPNPCTFVCGETLDETGFSYENVLSVVDVDIVDEGTSTSTDDDITLLTKSWKTQFALNLDSGSDWCDVTKGPLWKVELHRLDDDDDGHIDKPCALVFTFNHAISDQSSVNMLIDHLVSNMASIESNNGNNGTNNTSDGSNIPPKAKKQNIPVSMEDSVLGLNQSFSNVQMDGMSLQTVSYVANKAMEGFRNPVILPDDNTNKKDDDDGNGMLGALTIISGNAAGGENTEERKSIVQFRKIPKETTEKLLMKCREKGVTMSNVLSAAIALTSSDFINGNDNNNSNGDGKDRNYKVLQSLDMRRFGSQIDSCDTVSCMAGSHDLMLGPIPDNSGRRIRTTRNIDLDQDFWPLVKTSKDQTQDFITNNGPEEATRVFDFAMSISDMNNLVYLSAQSKDTLGRAYSAGIVNAGVFERQKAVQRENGSDGSDSDRDNLKTQHGRYSIQEVYYATSHARSGCLYQASCMTVNDELMCTFHPASPIVSEETNEEFADSFVQLLRIVSGESDAVTVTNDNNENSMGGILKQLKQAPMLAAVGYGLFGLISHANAWSNFFNSVMEMKNNVANPEDFWAALNFWIFFAVGHPILQPILWISDVLHGTPGPMIGDLVPALFLGGNLAFIALLSFSKEVKNAVNVFALSAFLSYVGAGLDGNAGLGDYNLGLDDRYNGNIVRGCPSYDEVRQGSMDNFDINKYEGLWYEIKFHDWTQFKEVYDTTLDIKLTSDGKGWIDDFAVKGPAPDSAPLSWDKSPVANGAHYFLFGRIDENDPPGILREKGFGVEFPNYIVDVKKDPETGDYLEAIQFQCLERGGVRVFEGINFMSRNPYMTEEELTAMHQRAKEAGMYPFGASPEQMHTVARRPIDANAIDNTWQKMWRAIGVDKLLELLTESIEDGGR